ncbi:tetratricopeptide repeat protein [Marinihelvus fidelis]|nr:tetratricopeptide repeat protein [Marinihelvus fidelis]
MLPMLLLMLVSTLLVAFAPFAMASEGFVGTAACADCHAEEHAAWTGSHHDLAMQHASDESVLGDFNDAVVTVQGVTSRFFRRDGDFFVNTEGPDGQLADFKISYTFGVDPLQQYLVEFPDGRVQALGLAWDARAESTGGQRWFHLYPDEAIPHDDPLHWTGRQQNWNYMCADCHSTDLVKGYDAVNDRYATTWTDINVGCEACHGPGEAHVSWAGKTDELKGQDVSRGLAILLDERDGVTWPIDTDTGIARRSSPKTTDTEIQVCATCHSRRGTIAGGAQTRAAFMDHHMPALLTGDLYHDDGQIMDEVYVWGSFLQSKMYAAGVTCSDCHNPHTLELRAPQQAVCAQCHMPATFATPDHHGHPADSAGADCLACHMPETTYMVVDPRRDHSLRVPRPDIALALGTPDACSSCHADRDTQWAADAFGTMFPDAGEPFQDWTRAFHQSREGLLQAEVSLMRVINDDTTPDIARATAVLELQGHLGPMSFQQVQLALRDPSPLVRMAAVRTLDAVPPANRYEFAGHLLRDPVLAVRAEAGRSLAGTPRNLLDVNERGALDLALRDYAATQAYNADRPEAHMNMGNLYAARGDGTAAEKAYRQALKLDPAFSPAYANLADLYRSQGMERESRAVLETGLGAAPDDASLHHALGLAMVRAGDTAAALPELERSAELAPDNPRYAYVYGVALNSTGQGAAAIEALETAQAQHPNNRELMWALATFERDSGDVAAARRWATAILALNPADEAANQLLASLPGEDESTE